MTEKEFIDAVIFEAQRHGYLVESSRNGRQIDFGHKKLHEKHLCRPYPAILREDMDIAGLIDVVALGRPCSHRPMKEILARIRKLSGQH